ncbi:Protein root UVB sensitive 3, variant 3 [Trifolium repens]|nr:Protein root UVB sensitive 3, variant 3 [Trifolium repens]
MYANYRAVRCLALNSLNPERSSILLQHFTETGQVLSPKQVSSLEHVLPLQFTSWSSKKANSLDTKVRLGTRISSFDEIEIQIAFKVFYVTFKVLANNVHKGKSLHSDSQMWMEKQYEVFIQKFEKNKGVEP